MRIGSLFSGYGGLDLAVQQVMGGDIAWTVENDPAACRVLAARHPGVPNHGDVTRIDWAAIEPVDLITAGYPCQPFSVAGQRRGTDDERHLWPHAAAAVRVLRPGWIVLENVAGHLRLGFDAVLADLAALGFDAEWIVVPASGVGAPHRRDRLFVLAWPAADPDRAARAQRNEEYRCELLQNQSHRGAAADPPDMGHGAEGPGAVGGTQEMEHAEKGQDLQKPVDNRFAADPVRELLHRAGDAGQGRRGEPADRGARPVALPLTPTSQAAKHAALAPSEETGDRPQDDSNLWVVAARNAFGPYQSAITRWEQTLGRTAPPPTEPGLDGRPRLSPRFVEWMMGLPEGWATAVPGVTRNQQLKILGNGVVPQQAAHALRTLLDRA